MKITIYLVKGEGGRVYWSWTAPDAPGAVLILTKMIRVCQTYWAYPADVQIGVIPPIPSCEEIHGMPAARRSQGQ